NRSLRFDTDNLRARNLKVMALRKLGQTAEAAKLLQKSLRLDRLNWWARQLVCDKITCDLQTQLYIAHDYARAGFYDEAVALLSAAAMRTGNDCFSLSSSEGEKDGERGPSNDAHVNRSLPTQDLGALPLLHYTLGWLEQRRGNDKIATKHSQHAATLSTDYCFPSRLEENAVLEATMRAN